jgi:hypothetical protein
MQTEIILLCPQRGNPPPLPQRGRRGEKENTVSKFKGKAPYLKKPKWGIPVKTERYKREGNRCGSVRVEGSVPAPEKKRIPRKEAERDPCVIIQKESGIQA